MKKANTHTHTNDIKTQGNTRKTHVTQKNTKKRHMRAHWNADKADHASTLKRGQNESHTHTYTRRGFEAYTIYRNLAQATLQIILEIAHLRELSDLFKAQCAVNLMCYFVRNCHFVLLSRKIERIEDYKENSVKLDNLLSTEIGIRHNISQCIDWMAQFNIPKKKLDRLEKKLEDRRDEMSRV